jgi:DNA-binding CsgD family transcriptional regulator
MKDFSSNDIMHFWKKQYSSQLSKSSKYVPSDQFHHIANMCAPGHSYYYILNLNDFSLDFIHPNVEKVVGIKVEHATMDTLLKAALPKEIEVIIKKEKIIREFTERFRGGDDLLFYKIVYTYRCKGLNKKIQTMMVQSTALSVSDSGIMDHAFVIHTDISHLGNVSTDWVSFISLNGKESFFNIKAHHERFDPKLANQEKAALSSELTKREQEIVKLMSQGLNAQAISDRLFISFHTTRTHRKNILSKTNCANTAELIGKCLAEGVI